MAQKVGEIKSKIRRKKKKKRFQKKPRLFLNLPCLASKSTMMGSRALNPSNMLRMLNLVNLWNPVMLGNHKKLQLQNIVPTLAREKAQGRMTIVWVITLRNEWKTLIKNKNMMTMRK